MQKHGASRFYAMLPSNHFKDLDNTFGTLPLSNPATLHKTGWHHAFALDLSYFFAQCLVYKFWTQKLQHSLLFDATRNRNILLTRVQNYIHPQ